VRSEEIRQLGPKQAESLAKIIVQLPRDAAAFFLQSYLYWRDEAIPGRIVR
jgi:hypothetical protein